VKTILKNSTPLLSTNIAVILNAFTATKIFILALSTNITAINSVILSPRLFNSTIKLMLTIANNHLKLNPRNIVSFKGNASYISDKT
jgi:hypothetical protein